MRVWDCLGVVWFFENNHSSLFTQFSSLVTHHSSLKIPQFSIPPVWHIFFSFSLLKFFYSLWDPYLSTWSETTHLTLIPHHFLHFSFPLHPFSNVTLPKHKPEPMWVYCQINVFFIFLLKNPKVAPSVVFHRSFFFGSTSDKAGLRFWIKNLKKPTSNAIDEKSKTKRERKTE